MNIVLIAGFSNVEIREHLEFKKDRNWYHWLIRALGIPARVGEFWDSTPWVKNIIDEVEKQNDMELHVVGPHIRLKKSIETFQLRGVTYHYYRTEWTSLLRKLNNYKLWKRLQKSTSYVRKILDEVQPDLVVLSGTENPPSSVGILAADEFPRLCLQQTIYNNPLRSEYGKPNRLIQDVEKDIFSQLNYFGVYCKMHYDLLHEYRPDAVIFKFGYPSKGVLLIPSEVKKEYDFVNFAQMHGSRKGTPDSIKALAIVKKKYPEVKLNIVGGYDAARLDNLKQLCEELDLTDNVSFTSFFERKEDLLLHIQKSRFAVLPCKLDNTSGTMTQSMQLGLPLVVYKTTGTPAFNRKKECVLIAEKGNVEQLAQHMLTLMDNPEKAESLKRNARELQEQRMVEARKNGERLMQTFRAIVACEKDKTPIPQELLFNPDKDD